ncbi:unnamed protein product [Orchesella dallaii]|uniref:Odorant receptor n=1 Tax=Orchesella dallaii TaxID=48710 RepID=A0ABP1S983_9HEXA
MAAVEYAILASPTLKWQSRSLERLMDYYWTVKDITNELNKTFGKMLIVVFVSVLPSLGFCLSTMFPAQGIQIPMLVSDHIRTIHIFTTLFIFSLMAANGSSNVQMFTEVAFEQLWRSRRVEEREAKKLSLIMQYVKSSCVGVGGDPFFLITYKFVGSKFVVVLILWVHFIITGYPDVSRLSATLNMLQSESPVIYLKLVMTICFVILFQIAVSVQYALAAVSMFYIGNRFQTVASGEYLILASPTQNWQSSSLERLMDYYLTVKHLTKVINRTYGIAIIIDFISVLPALGLGLANIFPTGETKQGIYLVDHIRTVYTLTRMYILALLAANGSSNVQEFAEVAFEQLWKSRGLENHDTRKLSLITHHVKSSCVGVGGEPFFVITYKFIGSFFPSPSPPPNEMKKLMKEEI